MSLTIPESLNVKQGEIIAIKADDWNRVNQTLDKLNTWRQTPIRVPLNGHDSVSPSTVIPKDYGLSIFNNISTTAVNSNDVIYAKYFNELVNKINQMSNQSLEKAVANETLISAKIINDLMEKYSKLETSFVVAVKYIDYVEGIPVETIATLTFEFKE